MKKSTITEEKISYAVTILPRLLLLIVWPLCRLVFGFFMRMEVRGLENLQGLPRNVIFAPNHASELDPFVARAGLPLFTKWSPWFYVVAAQDSLRNNAQLGWRRYLYGWPIMRYVLYATGTYPLLEGQKNYARSLSTHIKILKSGYPVCMFPEGKMTKDGKLQEGRGGVIYLTEATDSYIVPVGIKGTYKIRGVLARHPRITVTFGAPIKVSELQGDDSHPRGPYAAKVEDLMSKINDLLT